MPAFLPLELAALGVLFLLNALISASEIAMASLSRAKMGSWDEDHLLPRLWDGNGHATGVMAPGGYICRVSPDGKNWDFFCGGFRNQFDFAFNCDGELFVYDADMEWDWGMPWYRPTRVNHCVSGGEYGWRSGTGKWPDYYPDSLGAIDIGVGCPTGVGLVRASVSWA